MLSFAFYTFVFINHIINSLIIILCILKILDYIHAKI